MIPVRLRRQKLLACAHDFQLSLDKNELFQWEDIRGRHQKSGYGERFLNKIQKWNDECQVSSEQPSKDSTSATASLLALSKQIWRTVIPQMEVLRPGWHTYLRKTLVPLYGSCQNDTELTEIYAAFAHDYSDWAIHEEQLLLYWIYTYSVSSFTTSSKSVISLLPLACHIPVIPGLIDIRLLW